jgi:hypothetical protein
VGIQEVRWNKDGTQPADDYSVFCENRNADHYLRTDKATILAVRRVEFVSDRMSFNTKRSLV